MTQVTAYGKDGSEREFLMPEDWTVEQPMESYEDDECRYSIDLNERGWAVYGHWFVSGHRYVIQCDTWDDALTELAGIVRGIETDRSIEANAR